MPSKPRWRSTTERVLIIDCGTPSIETVITALLRKQMLDKETIERRLRKVTECFYHSVSGVFQAWAIATEDVGKLPGDFIDNTDLTSERNRARVRIIVKDAGIRVRTFAWVMGEAQMRTPQGREWI